MINWLLLPYEALHRSFLGALLIVLKVFSAANQVTRFSSLVQPNGNLPITVRTIFWKIYEPEQQCR